MPHLLGTQATVRRPSSPACGSFRDQRERDLDLPEGPPFEVPLLLQDRNFERDPDGQLTGELVHKTDPGTMEAFAPFTVVNGKVWPVLDVQPATYRLRMINGSNARTFRLVLVGDSRPELDRITQIGADGGLFGAPVASRQGGLCWPPLSARTCSLTSQTSSRAASSRSSTPPACRSTAHRFRPWGKDRSANRILRSRQFKYSSSPWPGCVASAFSPVGEQATGSRSVGTSSRSRSCRPGRRRRPDG